MYVSPWKIYTSVYTSVAEYISYYAVPDSRNKNVSQLKA